MKLSASQQDIFLKLLKQPDNYYIRKRVSLLSNSVNHALYSGKQRLEKLITDRQMNSKFRSLLKKGTKGRMTLNLSIIRQQDGRTWIKKQYKKLKSIQHEKV